jgi:hypothetical protein
VHVGLELTFILFCCGYQNKGHKIIKIMEEQPVLQYGVAAYEAAYERFNHIVKKGKGFPRRQLGCHQTLPRRNN